MSSYGRLSTAFYDLDKPVAPPDAIAFYGARAARASGRVLEPMCGSGRFLIPLLQAGVPIEGTDASLEMLTACRARAKALGLVPTLYRQNLEELALPRRYGMAFIAAGSLGLMHRPAALAESLRRLRRHLEPGASLLVELADAAGFEADTDGPGWRTVDAGAGRSIAYTWRSNYDADARTIRYDSRYELREAERVLAEESEVLALKLYTPQEMLDALRLAGFCGCRVVPMADDMDWLRESGCSLYEGRVPDSIGDEASPVTSGSTVSD